MIQRPLVSIDSGFAVAGWARWRDGAHPANAVAALKRFDSCGMIRTSPDLSEAARLVELHHAIVGVITDAQRALKLRTTEWPDVVIEVPSVPFASKKRSQGVQDLTLGCGAIIVAAALTVGPENVKLAGAPSGKWATKSRKHAWLRAQCVDAGTPWPTGIRGGKLEDVWDAMWLGVQVLRTPPLT